MENTEFDDEVNNLIEWCEDLDYEKYTENWHEIATSNTVEPPQPVMAEPFRISGQQLGGFTFERAQIMALQQELQAEGVAMDGPQQVTQSLIDQNIAQIQREQMQQQLMQSNYQAQLAEMNAQYTGQTEFHRLQKAQEERFVKSNLDYENRLRGHMYQFDEAEHLRSGDRVVPGALPGQGSGGSLQQKAGDQGSQHLNVGGVKS